MWTSSQMNVGEPTLQLWSSAIKFFLIVFAMFVDSLTIAVIIVDPRLLVTSDSGDFLPFPIHRTGRKIPINLVPNLALSRNQINHEPQSCVCECKYECVCGFGRMCMDVQQNDRPLCSAHLFRRVLFCSPRSLDHLFHRPRRIIPILFRSVSESGTF